jgi:ACS family hexuronate transporter-like MFS transporter
MTPNPDAPDAPLGAQHPAVSAAARARWLVIGLVFMASALNYVDRQVLALLKPTLTAEFGWTNADFARMGSAFQLATAGALLGVGWFVDRFGVRLAYGLAVFFWSVAGMAHAFAANVQQFVLARVALAAAEAVNTPAAIKAARVYLPVKERSIGIGIVNTAPNIGAIATPLIIPPFALAFGWKAAFIVTGALGFLWILAWWLGTRKVKPVVAEVAGAKREPVNWGALFSDRRSWVIIGAKFLTDAVWVFILFWSPDFFAKQFNLSQGQIGGPTALIFTLAAIGALSSGALTPFLMSRGASLNTARKSSMLFFSCCVLCMPLAMLAPNAWVAAALIGVGLFAHQGFSTNVFGVATEIIPQARVASVIAMGAVAANLSGMAIIEITGWALDNGHGYGPMFVYCGVAYLLATAWVHLMQPRLTLADAQTQG